MIFDQFDGVFAPIPTPFSPKDRTINFGFIKKHLDFLNEKGFKAKNIIGGMVEYRKKGY